MNDAYSMIGAIVCGLVSIVVSALIAFFLLCVILKFDECMDKYLSEDKRKAR